MPYSTERGTAPGPSPEAALLEKIEELSFLRSLNDRLARAPDFATACRALVNLVWEDGRADAVAYVSVDLQRRLCHLEAIAPDVDEGETTQEFSLKTPPFAALLGQGEPVLVLNEAPPDWLAPNTGRSSQDQPVLASRGALMGAVMRVRDAPTGILLVYTRRDPDGLEEDRRLLAITATSAALALEAARNEAREEFLAMLRHDINNPVGAALECARLIADELPDHTESEILLRFSKAMIDSLEAVVDLVSNYLHMAAIDRRVPWLQLEKLDLGDLVASIVDRHRPSAEEKQQSLTFEGSCPSARCDRRQLTRVITNLVSNAIKYTPPSGRVEVSVASSKVCATLRVVDTGYGLSAEELPRLFTKYARFHQDRGIPGTGLGLYISKAIVEAHGGSIEVSSEPDRGTAFTVHLPHDTA